MKDPAFLFYTNDFDSGTKFLTNEQLGVYIRLLMAQHQHGRLSEKQILFIASVMDPDIMNKFIKDESGLFYNKRLEQEITKRKSFADSRRKNVNKRYQTTSELTSVSTSVEHMNVHMEDINRNENENKNLNGFLANSEHLNFLLTGTQAHAAVEYLQITKQKKVSKDFILKLWQIFKIKEFTGKKWYSDEGAVFTHFLNSLKYEKIEESASGPAVKHNDSKANNILSMTD